MLPEGGGWNDQPDWFIHDAIIISARLEYLKDNKEKADEALEAFQAARKLRGK